MQSEAPESDDTSTNPEGATPTDGPDRTDEATSRAYYDEFATVYEQRRAGNVPGGYHDLLDHLEAHAEPIVVIVAHAPDGLEAALDRRAVTVEHLQVRGPSVGLGLAQSARRQQVGYQLGPFTLLRVGSKGSHLSGQLIHFAGLGLPGPDRTFDGG